MSRSRISIAMAKHLGMIGLVTVAVLPVTSAVVARRAVVNSAAWAAVMTAIRNGKSHLGEAISKYILWWRDRVRGTQGKVVQALDDRRQDLKLEQIAKRTVIATTLTDGYVKAAADAAGRAAYDKAVADYTERATHQRAELVEEIKQLDADRAKLLATAIKFENQF